MTMRLPAAAVSAHLEFARHKLQAVNRAHAVTKAIQKGLDLLKVDMAVPLRHGRA